MSKILFVTSFFILISITVYSQVGINTEDPDATLHVNATALDSTTAEGIIAPRLTRIELADKDDNYSFDQIGTIVYVSDTIGSKTIKTANIRNLGYYYFDGTLWQPIAGADGGSVPGVFAKLVASAGFDSQSGAYCTSDLGSSVRRVMFTGRRYDPGKTYDNNTGRFKAPSNGYYKFEGVLVLYNATGGGLTDAILRLGVSKPGEWNFSGGNSSFANFNQQLCASHNPGEPIVIPYSGLQYLEEGDEVAFGTRYMDPTKMTNQLSNLNYDIKTASYMAITFMGR